MLSLKKVIWALLSNVVDLMIGVGLLILVTRFYSTEDAGRWILFTTIFFLITRIREGVIQTALNKSGSGVDEQCRYDAMKLSFTVNTVLEFVISIIFLSIGLLGLGESINDFLLFYPLGAIPWAAYRWQVYAHLLQHQVEVIFRGNVLVFICLVISTLLVYRMELPVHYLVLVLSVSGSVGAIYGIGVIGIKKLWKSNYREEHIKVIKRYGGHGALRGFTGNITNRINVFLTAGLLTMTDTAIYGVAQKYIHLVLMPNSAIQSLLFPKFCEAANQGEHKLVKHMFENTVSSLMGMFVIVVVGAFFIAPIAVPIVNGPEYQRSIPLIMAILCMSAITAPFGNAFGSAINAIGKPEVNTWLLIVVSLVNVIATYVMISLFGLWGTILGPLVAELVSLIWTSVIMNRELNINYIRCFLMIPTSYQKVWNKASKAYVRSRQGNSSNTKN
ncbi:lipopolysaccharide biosynthesis protein [Algivirga pacifica]|uniref:Membrane protein involved in the export of O-antigen and teichoic acid n=1 Tax=Algivirga pacifica TaxID=1162670 RepID=A0ABP9DK33_9BACT